jgi:hypothetical protein
MGSYLVLVVGVNPLFVVPPSGGKASTTLIRPMKFCDDKSKAPASFLFSLGLGLSLSLFVSNQLLPPTSRIRLAAIDGAMAGMMLTELTDTMFFRLRFVIFIFNEFASDRNLNH